MTDTVKSITNREENLLRCDFFTLTIYFRLFLAQMFPQYDKGIYLDSDIVVPGDISQLYQTPLTGRAGHCRLPGFLHPGYPGAGALSGMRHRREAAGIYQFRRTGDEFQVPAGASV